MDDKATVIVCTRERYSLTQTSLESVLAHTPRPERIVYADLGSPPAIQRYLQRRAAEVGFRLVRYDTWEWPTRVRRALLEDVETEYVAFIDNDVLVEPRWLERLIDCADETGAGVVGPLYLWGDGRSEPTIHMAGGALRTGNPGVLFEAHVMMDAPLSRAAALRRKPVDFVEYHCMVARTDLVRLPDALDPEILSVHEHIDLALFSRAHGRPVYMEPTVRVTYLAKAPSKAEDLALNRFRWNPETARDSLRAFARKHDCAYPNAGFDGVLGFVERHTPLKPDWTGDRSALMGRADHAQTRTDLLQKAADLGYGPNDLKRLRNSFTLALFIMDGLYRPDGRPFLNHLIGTASVLVHYGFCTPVVVAGLLHAALTHFNGRFTRSQVVERLAKLEARAAALVDAYAAPAITGPVKAGRLASLQDEDLLCIMAANELDELLSGEVKATGRKDGLGAPARTALAGVTQRIGAPGLALSLDAATRSLTGEPVVSNLKASFALDHGAFKLRGMGNLVPASEPIGLG